MDEFVRAWRDGVVPLRRSQGYTIEAAWSAPSDSSFLWIVAYGGPLPWDEAEARYYASAERAALEPDPAGWVLEQRTWFITPVDLSS